MSKAQRNSSHHFFSANRFILNWMLTGLLFFPMALSAQKSDTAKLLTASRAQTVSDIKGWIFPYLRWLYKVGDDTAWAKRDLDERGWKPGNLDDMPWNSKEIPAGSVVWFRLRIKNDSSFAQPLIMRVYQIGASEIYLDGKLIHRFGKIGDSPGTSSFYNPSMDNFSFPLQTDSAQVLAVRFLNMPAGYPKYLNDIDNGFYIRIAKADDAERDYEHRTSDSYGYKIAIVFGATMLLSILFFSLYLYFRQQRINLFFALSTCCLAIYLALEYTTINYHGSRPALSLPMALCGVGYVTLLLFSIYKTLGEPIRWQFWLFVTVGLLIIPAGYLIKVNVLTLILAIFLSADGLRVTVKSFRKKNNSGIIVILLSFMLNFCYWILLLLDSFQVVTINELNSYTPFAYFILPLSLAIYIGYLFGSASQSLRQKLLEVEQLSNEKQHLLATQNEMLEKQVSERTAALHQSLEELKSTQQQLIQSEKMASLGELTAGIAHEIQNPLNFVNNFSELSSELIDEMNAELDKADIDEAKIIATDIKQNLEKINHHGKRADAIVKGMLQHSRSSTGQKEATDINALCDEYLRLSYHGLRAKDKSFNAILNTNFDESIGKINIIPQDMGRVIMNLLTNAFYAVNEKAKPATISQPASPNPQPKITYQPTVSISTKKTGNQILITINDNGNGIPQNIIDKIFQPFFTTKPTGQGTGLGLSLSYDIVKAHGGELKVETKESGGTTFIIQLPTV